MRSPRPAVALLASSLAATPTTLRAEPQGTVGLTVGAALRGDDTQWARTGDFHLGLRGDVMFGREGPNDFGAGPWAMVSTHAFDEVAFGGGPSLLLPVLPTFPMVLAAGPYARVGDETPPGPGGFRLMGRGLEGGIAASWFWGTRSYNFHGSYGMAAGLLVEGRFGLGPSQERSIIIGAQLDLVAISLPFQFLVSAIKGPSRDARPVTPSKK